MSKLIKSTVFLSLCVSLILFASVCVAAQTDRERSARKARAAADQSAKAARVFDQIMATREKSIPQDLLDRAEAVAVFPGVIKAGFIIGGRGGSGVRKRRGGGGLGAPAVFDFGGGRSGLENGGGSTRFILAFIKEPATWRAA